MFPADSIPELTWLIEILKLQNFKESTIPIPYLRKDGRPRGHFIDNLPTPDPLIAMGTEKVIIRRYPSRRRFESEVITMMVLGKVTLTLQYE